MNTNVYIKLSQNVIPCTVVLFYCCCSAFTYFNDVHIFNLDTYTWTRAKTSGKPPAQRSGCSTSLFNCMKCPTHNMNSGRIRLQRFAWFRWRTATRCLCMEVTASNEWRRMTRKEWLTQTCSHWSESVVASGRGFLSISQGQGHRLAVDALPLRRLVIVRSCLVVSSMRFECCYNHGVMVLGFHVACVVVFVQQSEDGIEGQFLDHMFSLDLTKGCWQQIHLRCEICCK